MQQNSVKGLVVERQQPEVELFGHTASLQLPESTNIQYSHFGVYPECVDKPKGKRSWKWQAIQAKLNMTASGWILLSDNDSEILFSSANGPICWVSLDFIIAMQV